LTDESPHQAKLDQFDLAFRASVQFGEPCRNSIDHQDVDFEPGII
jgi:hypothetical protein